jgi:nicotinamide mononucleotide (NMN) deamidase PncC
MKNVGLVYVGVAERGQNSESIECRFGELPREEIRNLSLESALQLLEKVLNRRLGTR